MSNEFSPEAGLEEIAERALVFQRYIFRRAWGTYYAVWAAAFFGFVFGTFLPLQLIMPGTYFWVPYALFYGGIGWGAGLATALIFRDAHRAVALRRAVGSIPRIPGTRYTLMWFWWVGFYAIAFLAFEFLRSDALSILYAMLFSIEIYIYYILKFSFPGSMPFEGKVALSSYGFAVVFSFGASLFTSNSLPFGIVWGITIVLWLFSALYALLRSSEELEALVY